MTLTTFDTAKPGKTEASTSHIEKVFIFVLTYPAPPCIPSGVNLIITPMKTAKTATRTATYAVEVWDTEKNGKREIDVEARDRRQAAGMVRKMGFEVRAVNYLG